MLLKVVATVFVLGFVALAVAGHVLLLQAFLHSRPGRPAREDAAPPQAVRHKLPA